jgi:DNA-binding CsgD family transcriptional regulator
MDLTRTEKTILHHLAWGKTYREILTVMNEERAKNPGEGKLAGRPMSLFTLHTVCCRIRQKTGIKSTKDAKECRNWERTHLRYTPIQKEKGPSPRQLQILRLLAEDRAYPEICQTMGLNMQSAMNLASEARKRVKITDKLRSSVRNYLIHSGPAANGGYDLMVAPHEMQPKAPNGCLNGDPCF